MTATAARLHSRGARERLLGSETPRIFTSPLRELKPAVRDDDGRVIEPATSLGYDAILFATEVLGMFLAPWQRWLLIHMLELREDGRLRFRKVVVLVARQNGKSTLSVVLSLFFMYVLGSRLVLGTAQDLETAEDFWTQAVEMAQGVPELADQIDAVVKTNGQKSLNLITKEMYKVKAANRRAARGKAANLVIMDELREQQTWDSYSAITKTTNARPNAIVVMLSNAGDVTSVVLSHLRKMAHAALGDPDGINRNDELLDGGWTITGPGSVEADVFGEDEDDTTLGLFEWSAKPGCSRFDPAGWAQANPSLGYFVERATIASDAASDPEWVFRTEVLCQWSAGALEGPFPAGAWEAGVDEDSARDPDRDRIVVGVDVAHDRSVARIVSASWRSDGNVHIEVVAQRAGTDWVVPWFRDPDHPRRREYEVTGQGKGAPVSTLIEELAELVDEDGVPLLRVVPWEGDDLPKGCGRFFDGVVGVRESEDDSPSPTIFHRPTATLDVAAAHAKTRPLSDGWAWDRKSSPVDISSLVAATAAHCLLTRPQEESVSAYETHGLELV